ncbi:MAG: porin [Pirellulaceae bacterium]
MDSGQYNDLTVGFNWYWTDRTRVMFDWIHPVTNLETKPYGATASDVIAMRFDYNF